MILLSAVNFDWSLVIPFDSNQSDHRVSTPLMTQKNCFSLSQSPPTLKNLKLSLFFQESYPLDQPPQFSPVQAGIRYGAGLFFI